MVNHFIGVCHQVPQLEATVEVSAGKSCEFRYAQAMAGRSSRRGGNTSNSNGRIQALVEQKLAEGLQYEALQLYRGVVSRKSARGDDATAISIAEQGIGVLLREGYADSATELGNVLISILSDHELPPTDERVGTIVRLNSKYEDAKRAAVLAEEDRLVAQREKEGSTGDRDEVEKDQEEEDSRSAARGTPSVGALQVRLLDGDVGLVDTSHSLRNT